MLNRRLFTNCAPCAAIGLIATTVEADAQTPPPGFTRTVVNRIDYPGDRMATIQIVVDIEPNAVIARHTHPGIESGSVLEGESTLSVKGQPDRVIRAGDSTMIPPEIPHAVNNGAARSRVVAVYVVERDKPLASPAPE